MTWLSHFDGIWCVDFEFHAPDGERPSPVCMVARELLSGRRIRVWADDLRAMGGPPFAVGPRSLMVAYYASAELGCFLALGWPMPARILDLYAEFRCHTSGLMRPGGAGLLGACMYFGLDSLAVAEKDAMRQLAMRGGPYTPDEQRQLLDYCETDVVALTELLKAMGPKIDLPRALLRGRYMAAAAQMEWAGVPIDTVALERISNNSAALKEQLIERIDRDYGVYEGTTFKADRWASYLASNRIPWPTLPSGQLALDDDTFREMARLYPQVAPIRELRTTMSRLRLNDLAVGSDGRNRCLLSAFGSKTGRNQPSNSRFIFGPSAWLRSLIRPQPGMALAYIDFSQQELGIAAALSGDLRMQAAYLSDDFYLAFAKLAKAVPANATKRSHSAARDQFKVVALGVLYGLSAEGLARKLNVPTCRGRELLHLHRDAFRQFWKWSDAIQDQAILTGLLQTVFGWAVHIGPDVNPRSLRNFPMQANGAEMLRLACCTATEAGITVCCPVHDAVLIEAEEDRIDAVVVEMQEHMRRASEIVLDGFSLRSDATIVRYPDRYRDKRGEVMWSAVCDLLGGGFEDVR